MATQKVFCPKRGYAIELKKPMCHPRKFKTFQRRTNW